MEKSEVKSQEGRQDFVERIARFMYRLALFVLVVAVGVGVSVFGVCTNGKDVRHHRDRTEELRLCVWDSQVERDSAREQGREPVKPRSCEYKRPN